MNACWTRTPEDLFADLATSASGLSPEEAERRLAAVGPNVLSARDGSGVLRLALRQYESPLVLMLVFGMISTVFDLLTFFVLLHLFRASEPLFQTTWFVVSVLTELTVVLVLRTRLPSWRSRPSRLLVISTIVVASVSAIVPYVAGLARAFDFVPVPATLLGAGFGIVALYVATTEAAKAAYFSTAGRRRKRRAS